MLLNYQSHQNQYKIKMIHRDKCKWKHNIPKSLSQFPGRVVIKNVLTMGQLHSAPKLVKVMLKILHTRLQHYVNKELPDGHAELSKGRGTRDQNANIRWIIQKAGEFKKKSTSVSLTMPKPLTVWIIINCGKLFSSVQFSRSVVSDSLRPHESQHTRPPCPSPTPGVHSDSRSLSQ